MFQLQLPMSNWLLMMKSHNEVDLCFAFFFIDLAFQDAKRIRVMLWTRCVFKHGTTVRFSLFTVERNLISKRFGTLCVIKVGIKCFNAMLLIPVENCRGRLTLSLLFVIRTGIVPFIS